MRPFSRGTNPLPTTYVIWLLFGVAVKCCIWAEKNFIVRYILLFTTFNNASLKNLANQQPNLINAYAIRLRNLQQLLHNNELCPSWKIWLTPLEFVEFNSSVTLFQQYTILGKAAKEVGKVYEKSGDGTLKQLAQGYKVTVMCTLS